MSGHVDVCVFCWHVRCGNLNDNLKSAGLSGYFYPAKFNLSWHYVGSQRDTDSHPVCLLVGLGGTVHGGRR